MPETVAMPVEVIVPVYNAPAMLADCLQALATRLPDWARLQLIDDASPDPGVAQVLAQWQPRLPASVRVIRQPDNLGFVATVNAAIARCAGDVVLLNADTVVTSGWLERLRSCIASDARIASATPFSNNAEICSFPVFCRNNPVPDDPERIAAAAAAAITQTHYPDLPTAIGFCVWLRRAALVAIGDFDRATFGRGYGEENDWCLRATGHGWRHVLCPDAYVVHRGGASFATVGLAPNGEQLVRLLARYPHYNAAIADFIRRDPLAPWRQALAERLGVATA